MAKSPSSTRYLLNLERRDILETRTARQAESLLYKGGRSSDTTMRVINATTARGKSAERWPRLSLNLDRPLLKSGGVTIG